MRRPRPFRLAGLMLAACCLAASPLPPQPSPPPPGTKGDVFFGVTVPDPYRAFEDPKNPALRTYFRQQNAYTRRVLDGLPGRALLRARIARLDDAAEALSDLVVGRRAYFYLRRPAGASATRLYVRAIAGGAERLVLDPDRFAASKNVHYTIDYFAPSPDGRLVAAGVSEGGSEVEVLHVVDVASGRLLPDTIDRVPFSAPTWDRANRSF